MKTKKRRRYKKKQINYMKKVRFLIGAVLLIGILGNGMSITFAKQDVQSLLINWFTSKKDTAIEEIRVAIENERDIQIARVKEQLQLEIQQASQHIESFTKEEKNKRTSNLRNYADELINNINIDNSAEENSIQLELETIYQVAIQEMEKAVQERISGSTPETAPQQPAPTTEPETEDELDSESDPEPDPDTDPGSENE